MNNLYKILKEKYPDVKIVLIEDPKHIHIDSIEVPKKDRNKGIGTNILKIIVKYAREHNKTSSLIPSHQESDRDRLEQFYRRFGFKVSRCSRKKKLYRSDTMDLEF